MKTRKFNSDVATSSATRTNKNTLSEEADSLQPCLITSPHSPKQAPSVHSETDAVFYWNQLLESERQTRMRVDSLHPIIAQEQASLFPPNFAIHSLRRCNAAYPDRVISQFEDEFALET
jgi:hypothetical protein